MEPVNKFKARELTPGNKAGGVDPGNEARE